MSGRLLYDQGAKGFDQSFGLPMRQFIPTLIRLAQIEPGHQVLDLATGTGLAAEEALKAVGASGHVTAVDIAPPMLELARQRLGAYPNVTITEADAEALKFPAASFDTVICCMALMIFRDRAKVLADIHRVLRPGGRLSVSLNTTMERSLTAKVRSVVARYLPPERAEAIAEERKHHFGLGEPDRVRPLFAAAGFTNIETVLETRNFSYPAFEDYFAPFEQGGGPWGAEYVGLPPDIRQAIRDQQCREMGGEGGGPVSVDVDILYCSGTR